MSKESENHLQQINEQYEQAKEQLRNHQENAKFWEQRVWYLMGKRDVLAEQRQKVEKPKKKK